ncbi:MAG TPA: rhomboid family intramembrane serine protease [Nakamurella sp.]
MSTPSGKPSDSSLPFSFPEPAIPSAYVPPPSGGVMPTGSPPAKRAGGSAVAQRVKPAVITIGALAALMIVLQTINWATDYRLATWGIDPRSWEGLLGVLFAPLLHGSWAHLWSNLVPLVIMGVLIMLSGVRQFVAVTALVWLVSGLGVWLVAPANTTTVGASGIVFGWLAFLIVRGIWTRTWQHLLLGLVLLAVYGSLFWTGIVKVAAADITGVVTVSWQAHLFGAIGGILAAFLVARADGPRRDAARTSIAS